MHDKPTLAYILKGYPRISETFISNEILLLEELGFRMRIFSMRQPRETFCHDSVKMIRAKVDYLPSELGPQFNDLLLPNLFLAVKSPKTYKQALQFAHKNISKKTSLATLKHLLQGGYLTNKFLRREEEIRHLHGHFAHSPTSVTLFSSLLSGLPFSFTAHAKDIYTSKPEKLKKRLERASFVVTCTKYNKDYLTSIAGAVTTPIHCLYHGSDLSLFSNTPAHYTTSEPFNIFTVARLTAKKGLPTVYRALAILRQRGLEFTHTLIGDGDDRDLILSTIEELGLEDRCKWLGTRTHSEVLKQFGQSDLFVLGCEISQNGDRDGIPNVLVESLAMGVPAISTNISAIPEILIDGRTGVTVPPSDPEKLADGMQRLLTDTKLRRNVIEGGQSFVKDNFDNRRLIGRLADIFRSHNQALAQPETVLE